MSEQLKHIFDISKCPTKRQVQDYLKGIMEPEEIYAFEHHISSCLLCSEALDGAMAHKEEAITGMGEINNNFLKDHLELHPPHIHLNSIAPSVIATGDVEHKKTATQHLWKPIGIAATLLLCLGIGWYFKNVWRSVNEEPIVQQHAPVLPYESVNNGNTRLTEDVPGKQAMSLAKNESLTSSNDNKQPSSTPRVMLLPGEQEEADTAFTAKPAIAAKAATEAADQAIAQNLPETSARKEDVALANVLKKEQAKTAALLSSPPDANKGLSADDVPERKKTNSGPDTEKTADELYKDEQYSKALTAYKKLINSSNAETSQYAKLMAAHCYLNLGQKRNAQKLLSDLADSGSGSEKREAKRLLNKLEKEGEQ